MSKEFQTRLAEELETLFPKGEKCECGKRLQCRSRALVFNAMANIIFKESEKSSKTIIQEILEGFDKMTPEDFTKCNICKEPFTKIDAYTWKGNCEHISRDLRFSSGGIKKEKPEKIEKIGKPDETFICLALLRSKINEIITFLNSHPNIGGNEI